MSLLLLFAGEARRTGGKSPSASAASHAAPKGTATSAVPKATATNSKPG